MLHLLEEVIVWPEKQRMTPERLVASADEEIAKSHSGERRPHRQHSERGQHNERRFMRVMIAVAMISMPRSIMRAGSARPPVATLPEEGHEHQAPGIERGQRGGDVGA